MADHLLEKSREEVAARDETIEQLKERIDSLVETINDQKDEIAKYKGIIQGVAKPIIKAWLEMDS